MFSKSAENQPIFTQFYVYHVDRFTRLIGKKYEFKMAVMALLILYQSSLFASLQSLITALVAKGS